MSDIARDMKHHPERAIVAHPWNPVHLVPLVELSPGEKTSQGTVDLSGGCRLSSRRRCWGS